MDIQPISGMQAVSGTGAQAASSPDASLFAGHVTTAGASSDTGAPKSESASTAPTAARVEAAVGEANRTMQAIDASVRFEIDPETKLTVIKVVNTDSNTVLRQVPAQEMLDIAQSLDRMQGLLLSLKA